MKKTYHFTRRRFLGAAASTAFAFQFVPNRVWGANERVNVAGIGAGGKGASDIAGAAKHGANIVALCDVDINRASGTFKKFDKAKQYTDFRVMLEKQKDIDAVTVSTPDHVHAVAAMAAMQLGKHVYCQKPLTHSIHEARVLTEAAAENKLITQMGNQAHAGEPIRRAVELVRAGILGKVTEAHVWTNRPIWPQGQAEALPKQKIPAGLDWDLWLGPAPKRDYNASYAPFKWRGWWDFGTGALGDMACHIMDMAYWSLELKYPDSVEAEQGGNTKQSGPNWSIITYQFPARGDNPPVKLVWYDGRKDGQANLPDDEASGGVNLKGYGSLLVGEKGNLYFNRGRTNWLVTGRDKDEVAQIQEDTPRSVPRTQDEDFEWIEGIKGGPTPLSHFAHSGPFTETVLLGNLAIRTGQKIDWDGPAMKPSVPEAEQYVRREYRKDWSL
ncbi:MAG: Gfo/Idh/MocA family oxidoreductase [Opitutales bacterium]